MKNKDKDRAKATRVKKAAVNFIRLGSARGRRAMTIAPITERKTIIDSQGKSKSLLSFYS